MQKFLFVATSFLFFVSAQSASAKSSAATENPASFSALSKTVFIQSCTSCHMQMSATEPAEAGIDLSSYTALVTSNQRAVNPKHAPFIIPGDPDHSKLYLAVKSGKMPATEDGSAAAALSPELIQNIYDWIKAGAADD